MIQVSAGMLSPAPAPTPATATRKTDPGVAGGTSTDTNVVKVEKKGDVTIRSFGAAAAKPADAAAQKPTATLTVVVRASENSWISVTSDGQLVTQETLIAPAPR